MTSKLLRRTLVPWSPKTATGDWRACVYMCSGCVGTSHSVKGFGFRAVSGLRAETCRKSLSLLYLLYLLCPRGARPPQPDSYPANPGAGAQKAGASPRIRQARATKFCGSSVYTLFGDRVPALLMVRQVCVCVCVCLCVCVCVCVWLAMTSLSLSLARARSHASLSQPTQARMPR